MLLTMCCLLTAGCQKDEQKLITANWQYDIGFKNGEESSRTGFTDFYRDAVNINDDGTFAWKLQGSDLDQGTWEFNEGKTTITFYYTTGSSLPDDFQTWAITKLTKRKLWVTENILGADYEYHFTR